MKHRFVTIIFLILIILPVILEGFWVCGIFKTSPNRKLIELCFKKEQTAENFVEFLDVGQGDSTLIKSGDSVILIDFGVEEDGAKIQKRLLKMGIKRIELAIITHHHKDHMGGYLKVAEKIKIENLVINNTTADDGDPELYNQIISVAKAENTKLILPIAGNNFKIGNADLTILSCNNSAGEENNRSVVLMLNMCGKKFLFTGDCEDAAEYNFMQNCDVKCDVLKVGHHGSKNSSNFMFLKAAQPKIAIVSCGYDNTYKHPADDTVSKLEELGAEIYRTDLDQSVLFAFDEGINNYKISTERNSA